MKTYHVTRQGLRTTDGVYVNVNEDGKVKKLSLGTSLKIRNHSPTGFNFGYGGSGPAQLALAILLDYSGKIPHPACYQDFKRQFIATMKEPGGAIAGVQIDAFLNKRVGEGKELWIEKEDLW